jgi:hypothetical protein
MTTDFTIVNHLSGVNDLIGQYRSKEYVTGLVLSYLSSTLNIEDTMYSMATALFNIDSAVGKQLDIVGDILNWKRTAADDELYRKDLKTIIKCHRSHGTWQNLVDVASYYSDLYTSGTTDFHVSSSITIAVSTGFSASIGTSLEVNLNPPITNSADLPSPYYPDKCYDFLHQAKAAGNELQLVVPQVNFGEDPNVHALRWSSIHDIGAEQTSSYGWSSAHYAANPQLGGRSGHVIGARSGYVTYPEYIDPESGWLVLDTGVHEFTSASLFDLLDPEPIYMTPGCSASFYFDTYYGANVLMFSGSSPGTTSSVVVYGAKSKLGGYKARFDFPIALQDYPTGGGRDEIGSFAFYLYGSGSTFHGFGPLHGQYGTSGMWRAAGNDILVAAENMGGPVPYNYPAIVSTHWTGSHVANQYPEFEVSASGDTWSGVMASDENFSAGQFPITSTDWDTIPVSGCLRWGVAIFGRGDIGQKIGRFPIQSVTISVG